MANFQESALRLVSLFKANGLYKSSLSDEELTAHIALLSEIEKSETCDPMIMGEISELKGVYVAQFDDCNAYGEPGYYETLLKEISAHSGNEVAFSDVNEMWDENGTCDLRFIYRGNEVALCLDTQAESDMVPSLFTEYLHTVLTEHDGERRYFPVQDIYGYIYYFLPSDLVKDLVEIRDFYVPSF